MFVPRALNSSGRVSLNCTVDNLFELTLKLADSSSSSWSVLLFLCEFIHYFGQPMILRHVLHSKYESLRVSGLLIVQNQTRQSSAPIQLRPY